jgi:hypothetical protein
LNQSFIDDEDGINNSKNRFQSIMDTLWIYFFNDVNEIYLFVLPRKIFIKLPGAMTNCNVSGILYFDACSINAKTKI